MTGTPCVLIAAPPPAIRAPRSPQSVDLQLAQNGNGLVHPRRGFEFRAPAGLEHRPAAVMMPLTERAVKCEY